VTKGYRHGIIDTDLEGKPNHAVMTVGYGVDSKTGKEYALVRNSWGEGWGDKGYFRIAMHQKYKDWGVGGMFWYNN